MRPALAVGAVFDVDAGRPDNVFIERLWRSLKYEAVSLHDLSDGFDAERLIGSWMALYNHRRPHSSLGARTPRKPAARLLCGGRVNEVAHWLFPTAHRAPKPGPAKGTLLLCVDTARDTLTRRRQAATLAIEGQSSQRSTP